MAELIATVAVSLVVVVGFLHRPTRWCIERYAAHRLSVHQIRADRDVARHSITIRSIVDDLDVRQNSDTPA